MGQAILIVPITHSLGHATIHLCTKFDGWNDGLLRLHRHLHGSAMLKRDKTCLNV